jgi:4-hydroxybenzoyl-CoA reductase subunit beta
MGTLGGNLCLDTRCHFINQTAFWRKSLGSCLKDVGEICQVAPGSSRCWAITSADLPPLLIALGARIRLVSARGERVIPLGDLYRDDGIAYLTARRDEILSEVLLEPVEGVRAGYLKLRRRGSFDFPALGVAAALRVDSAGVCKSARIVLGAVTSRPLDMTQAADLVGERISEDGINHVAEAMALQARPLQLADYTHSYRKQMIAVYAKRLLKQLSN